MEKYPFFRNKFQKNVIALNFSENIPEIAFQRR